MKYLESHECETLYKSSTDIAVEMYEKNGNKKWYWNKDNRLDQIIYCPYCGTLLTTSESYLM